MTAASGGTPGCAEYNHRCGPFIALAVAGIALYTATIVNAYAMRLTH